MPRGRIPSRKRRLDDADKKTIKEEAEDEEDVLLEVVDEDHLNMSLLGPEVGAEEEILDDGEPEEDVKPSQQMLQERLAPTPTPTIKPKPRLSIRSSYKSPTNIQKTGKLVPVLTNQKNQTLKSLPIEEMSMGTKLMKHQRSQPRTRSSDLHNEADMEKETLGDGEEEMIDDSPEVDCKLCYKLFHSELEVYEHFRASHRNILEKDQLISGSLLCGHPHCSASFPELDHLIAHLVVYHNQPQYRIRKIIFPNVPKFDAWRSNLEKSSKCNFLPTSEDEELLPDGSSRMDMFCEYCDEWRRSQKKSRIQHAEKLPSKTVGCPAHFTVTLDPQTNKATVIGCFSHLGHFKKANWTGFGPPEGLHPSRAGRNVSLQMQCPECMVWFRSKRALKAHSIDIHRNGAQVSPTKGPMLHCADPDCKKICESMISLVEHVSDVHRRDDLVVEEYKFKSFKDFELWRHKMEAETMSKFVKSSGRNGAGEIQKYLVCHLSGRTISKARRSDGTLIHDHLMRKRQTKKMGRHCTAFMSLKINKKDGSVTMKGCLGHFGHNFDVRRLPVPEPLRKEICDLLIRGVNEDDIIEHVRGKSLETERGFYLQKYEVRNMTIKLQREGYLGKSTYVPIPYEADLDRPRGLDLAHHYIAAFSRVDNEVEIREEAEEEMNKSISLPKASFSAAMPLAPPPARFRSMRTLSDIHATRRPFRTATRGYMGKNMRLAKLNQSMGVYEYVDDTDVCNDDEIFEVEDVNDDLPGITPSSEFFEAGGSQFGDDTFSATSSAAPQRKRMPLLNDPRRTGNLEFDKLMDNIKNRIESISSELKRTKDMSMAEMLLREVKSLEGRLAQGIGQTTVPKIQRMSTDEWVEQPAPEDEEEEDDFYEDYESEVEGEEVLEDNPATADARFMNFALNEAEQAVVANEEV